MLTIRRIGAVVLIVAAISVWFGMKPANTDTSSNYGASITAALAGDHANSARTAGAPQQAVVNARTARDLVTIIAEEGANPRPVDERPAALLTLLVIGFGWGLATTRLPVRGPARSSPLALESSLPTPAVTRPAAHDKPGDSGP
jgi:hypothetical protein